MSRGFVREGDQEEPPMIPPRASLPNGVPNYVTQEGFDALQNEKLALLKELADFKSEDEREGRRKSAEIAGKLNLLNERINSARVLEVKKQSLDEVRFGFKVTYVIGNGKPVTIQIVGVDEANIKERKISFIAPIARAMIGKKKGEHVLLDLGGEKRQITIVDIAK